jgi:hypothetical protein
MLGHEIPPAAVEVGCRGTHGGNRGPAQLNFLEGVLKFGIALFQDHLRLASRCQFASNRMLAEYRFGLEPPGV